MNKKVMSIFLVGSLSTYANMSGYTSGVPAHDIIFNHYCSPEALEDQLNRLKSEEERQLVAALLQLELSGASDETLKKFESSAEWKARTPAVTRLLKSLMLDDNGLASTNVYERCFESINPENRVVPGFEDKPRELMKPSAFARRAFRS